MEARMGRDRRTRCEARQRAPGTGDATAAILRSIQYRGRPMEREHSINSRPSGQVRGPGWPFGTRWSSVALLLGVLGYGLTIRAGFVAAAAVLLIAFAGHRRYCFPDIRFLGDIRAGHPFRRVLAVTV